MQTVFLWVNIIIIRILRLSHFINSSSHTGYLSGNGILVIYPLGTSLA